MKPFALYGNAKEPRYLVKIRKILDGRTMELEDGRRVRLIGIKLKDQGKKAEEILTELIDSNSVIIELDSAHKELNYKDKFGNYLTYVYVWGAKIKTLEGKYGRDKLIFDGFLNVKNSFIC